MTDILCSVLPVVLTGKGGREKGEEVTWSLELNIEVFLEDNLVSGPNRRRWGVPDTLFRLVHLT